MFQMGVANEEIKTVPIGNEMNACLYMYIIHNEIMNARLYIITMNHKLL